MSVYLSKLILITHIILGALIWVQQAAPSRGSLLKRSRKMTLNLHLPTSGTAMSCESQIPRGVDRLLKGTNMSEAFVEVDDKQTPLEELFAGILL